MSQSDPSIKNDRYDHATTIRLLTIVMLLVCSPKIWYLRAPLIICCAAGLTIRRWLEAPPFWYVLTTLFAIGIYFNWESTDNHKYMMAYWCLAICCACTLPRGQQSSALGLSARLLIGLCMLLSVVWKVANPQYLDGSFFEYTLLTDGRFARVTSVATDFTSADLKVNEELQQALVHGHLFATPVNAVELAQTPVIRPLAGFLTWWTVGIEAFLALVFLAPRSRLVGWLSNLTLLLFAVTTYSVATVRGFGWCLMLMGLAQCDDNQSKKFRPAYVFVFLLIQAYMVPYEAVARSWSYLFAILGG